MPKLETLGMIFYVCLKLSGLVMLIYGLAELVNPIWDSIVASITPEQQTWIVLVICGFILVFVPDIVTFRMKSPEKKKKKQEQKLVEDNKTNFFIFTHHKYLYIIRTRLSFKSFRDLYRQYHHIDPYDKMLTFEGFLLRSDVKNFKIFSVGEFANDPSSFELLIEYLAFPRCSELGVVKGY